MSSYAVMALLSTMVCSSSSVAGPADSVRVQAIRLVEHTLGLLMKSRDVGPFKNQFSSSAAKHPCDVCPEMTLMPVEEYAFHVNESYKDSFDFRYRIDLRHVEVEHDTLGRPVRVLVPYTKWVPLPSDKPDGMVRTRKLYLLAKVLLLDGVPNMETILEEKPPGRPLTVLEGFVGQPVGHDTYAEEALFDPTRNGLRSGIGVIRYFEPLGSLNRRNIWYKVGLRGVWSNIRLQQQRIAFFNNDVALTPALGPTSQLDQQVDMNWTVSDLEERTSVMSIEVPLGLSKRWVLGPRSFLALDLGIAIGYEVVKDLTGRYSLDQHGTDHRIGGTVMLGSGGAPVQYTDGEAAVVRLEDREEIRFFSDRQYVLDGADPLQGSTFSFGLTPSWFIGGRSGRLYRIGVDLSWAKRARSNTTLNEDYFRSEGDRPALSTLVNEGFRPWVSLVAGIVL